MGISTAELLAAGAGAAGAAMWAPALDAAATRYGILTREQCAMFVAQLAHESWGFCRLVENLNYSATALVATWPKHFPTVELAQPYARQPEKIANKVYANRMGNGDEASGDGWRNRGRGPLQLTGHDNLAACGRALGVDLLADPDLLTHPDLGAFSAGWFWQTRRLAALGGDVAAVTRRINGGLIGLPARTNLFQRVLEAA